MDQKLNEMLTRLATDGGKIVSSAACSALEIAEANAEGRMYVRDDGLGFIYVPRVLSISESS